jgi:hypothetical protein
MELLNQMDGFDVLGQVRQLLRMCLQMFDRQTYLSNFPAQSCVPFDIKRISTKEFS